MEMTAAFATERLWNSVGALDLQAVRDAINAGANVNGRDGLPPLCYATALGAEAIVNELLSAGASPRVNGSNPPVATAAFHGRVSILKRLIAADPKFALDQALRAAAIQKQTDCALALLAAGANPRANNSEALSWALRKDARSLIRLLLDSGAEMEPAVTAAEEFFRTGLIRNSKAADLRKLATTVEWACSGGSDVTNELPELQFA